MHHASGPKMGLKAKTNNVQCHPKMKKHNVQCHPKMKKHLAKNLGLKAKMKQASGPKMNQDLTRFDKI